MGFNNFHKLFFTLVKLLLLLKNVDLSHIDTNHPLVITDTSNSGSSHFGYSIAGTSSSRILISSPNAERKTRRGVQITSGDIWKCKINLKEVEGGLADVNPISCNLWNGLTQIQNSGDNVCCSANSQWNQCPEFQEKMWLGGSLSAVGENDFVACASRWSKHYERISDSKDRTMNGLCYHYVNGTLTRLEPPLRSGELLAFDGTNDLVWFYGQTGFSSALDASNQYVLLGSPGFYRWRGNAILYNLNEGQSACQSQAQYVKAYDAVSRGGDDMDYFGYHVASTKLGNGQASLFAAGSPRGKGRNSRTYMTGSSTFLAMRSRNIHGTPRLDVTTDIAGEQLGSYFGSMSAFVDIDGDGIEELFVGSPLYTIGQSSDSFDEGCVFMYSNNGQRMILKQKLCPVQEPGSRFGTSIESLGDINHDGYNDIGIGSPGSFNGTGAVFIYYGNRKGASLGIPQVIGVQELGRIGDVKGFGSVIFGNIDVDGNKSPDIIVGSWQSKQVIIYRTRPRIEFFPTITNHYGDARKSAIYRLQREDTSFIFRFCLAVRRYPKIDGPLGINVQVDFPATEERFRFQNKEASMKFSMILVSDDTPVCSNTAIRVNRETEIEVTNPRDIKVTWKVWYNNTQKDKWDPWSFPVTDVGQGKLARGAENFCTWCPLSKEMTYGHSLPIASDNCNQDGNDLCHSKLTVSAKLSPVIGSTSDINEYVIGSEEFRYIDVTIQNNGETAYSLTVNVITQYSKPELAKAFNIKIVNDNNRCFEIRDTTASPDSLPTKAYQCKDPLHTRKQEFLKLQIIPHQALWALPNNEKITFQVEAFPAGLYSEQKSVSELVTLNLISDVKLTLSKIDNERNTVQDVFKTSYEIANSGTSSLRNLHMKFYIPVTFSRYGVDQEALIVYEPKPNSKISCTTPNPKGFPSLMTAPPTIEAEGPVAGQSPNITLGVSRRRRSTNASMPATKEAQKASIDSPTAIGHDFRVDCAISLWKCVEIKCDLLPSASLSKDDRLTVELTMAFTQNATENLIPPQSTVVVITSATVWSFTENSDTILTASARTTLQSSSLDDLPAWLIFGSVIGGLIIFLLIAFCLFKCGFFRRKTKENLQTLKAQAEQEDNFNLPRNSAAIANRQSGETTTQE